MAVHAGVSGAYAVPAPGVDHLVPASLSSVPPCDPALPLRACTWPQAAGLWAPSAPALHPAKSLCLCTMLASLIQEAGFTNASFCHLHFHLLLIKQDYLSSLEKSLHSFSVSSGQSVFLKNWISFAKGLGSSLQSLEGKFLPCLYRQSPMTWEHRGSYYVLEWEGRERGKTGIKITIDSKLKILSSSNTHHPWLPLLRLGHPIFVRKYHLTPCSHISWLPWAQESIGLYTDMYTELEGRTGGLGEKHSSNWGRSPDPVD